MFPHRGNRRRYTPVLERVEERNLLSGLTVTPHWSLGQIGSLLGGQVGKIKDLDAAGYRSLMKALNGGAGAEFEQLLKKYHVNPLTVIGQFATKQRTSFVIPGFVGVVPQTMKSYTGSVGDQFNPTAAGAVLQKNGKLSLGAIMRGPIDLKQPVRYVWGLDTGRGARAIWPGHSRVKVDTLVTVDRAANGRIKLTIEDLVNHTTKTLSSSRVKIQGPTVRLKLDPGKDLPGGGKPISQAKFTFWVQNHAGDIKTVARFLPDRSLAIGVL